eukprot:CAMPEP_0115661826 /NCGR_PEP_ID=MMETSP0272-20121206/46994_1 /TAXON_ID=71861 /ORGANISM="Scrippsiella trochoidea, Strain CCMP3099" /LENGTH=30 /DNA_ID= /DNA_START= /DNA_END= /DNA_ORIENTATION=
MTNTTTTTTTTTTNKWMKLKDKYIAKKARK